MIPMHKLLIENKGNAKAPRKSGIEAKGGEATIYLYDAIVATDVDAAWWGGVSAESLVKEIRKLEATTIHLRINSPGGDVFAGRAIEQALRDHSAKVIAHIDGFAASAASFVMLAADEIEIAAGGFVMIHNAWSMALGNAEDMKKAAALLDKVDSTIVDSYAAKTGKEREVLEAWMAAETWFTGAEAVEQGFADRVAEGEQAAAMAGWKLSAYANAPKIEEPEKANAAPAPAEPAALTQAQQDQMRRELQMAVAAA